MVGGGCFVGASHSVQGVADALVEAVGLLTLGSVHLAVEAQGLLVGRESFLVAPQIAQNNTSVAQTIRLIRLPPVHLAEQLQGLLVGRDRLLVAPQVAQSDTSVVEAVGMLALSACRPTVEVLGLSVSRQGFVVLPHIGQGEADSVIQDIGLVLLGPVLLTEYGQGFSIGGDRLLAASQVAQSITGAARAVGLILCAAVQVLVEALGLLEGRDGVLILLLGVPDAARGSGGRGRALPGRR